MTSDPRAVAAAVQAQDMRALARLITALENGDPAAIPVMRLLSERPRRAQVVGVTGPPGSGKSTLVDKLIAVARGRGLRVGVLAVDPSSPFSGGAILGDRLRMNAHATDRGVFIRSLASRGVLGGLSRATLAAARALDAAGYDLILVETVGVGQSEVEVVRVADTVLLVAVPGLGDDIQVIKAGVMEIGDLFVVNKADRDGADRVVREIRTMLETAAALRRNALPERATVDTLAGRPGSEPGHLGPQHQVGANLIGHHAGLGPAQEGFEADALPPVTKTVAETGEGVEAVFDLLLAHHAAQAASGGLAARRLEGARSELLSLVHDRLDEGLDATEGSRLVGTLAADLIAGSTDLHAAAQRLVTYLLQGGF